MTDQPPPVSIQLHVGPIDVDDVGTALDAALDALDRQDVRDAERAAEEYRRAHDDGRMAMLDDLQTGVIVRVREIAAELDETAERQENNAAGEQHDAALRASLTSSARKLRIEASVHRHVAELIDQAVRERRRELEAAKAVERIRDDAEAALEAGA